MQLNCCIFPGEKPYTCSVCGRAFAQSNDLSTHKKRNTCSSSGVGTINLSGINAICNNSETEDHLILLTQNSQLEVTPIEASLPTKSQQNNHNYYKAKRKRTNKLERAINLATNVILRDEEDKIMCPAQSKALSAVASLENHFSINAASNSKVNDGDAFGAAKNVSDLIKHSFIVPDLMATQRALDFASGSPNIMAHQRVELTDFATAALLQIQSAHFGLR